MSKSYEQNFGEICSFLKKKKAQTLLNHLNIAG